LANKQILGRTKNLGGPGISTSNTSTHAGVKTTETKRISTEARGSETSAIYAAAKTTTKASRKIWKRGGGA
jgi:hypothetical protein